jgi:hypothetical protein
MTQKQAFTLIRSYGLSISKKENEYRINYKGDWAIEATAFYTMDLQDAIDTAKNGFPK